MTKPKTSDQKPRSIILSASQAIRLERTQADRAHLMEKYGQPLRELSDAEDAIQTALNAILTASKAEPSESGWHLSITDAAVTLVEGAPE